MDSLWSLLGRFHPVFVHLPIGLFVMLAIVEFAALFSRVPRLPSSLRTLVLAAGLVFALATAFFGWLLAIEGGYDAVLLERHQTLGLAVAAGAAVLLLAQLRGWHRTYGTLLVATVAAVGAAGHFGGSLTHGENYLTLASPVAKRVPPSDPAQALVFADVIHPILEQRCASCHGATKSNGDLRYDSLEQLLKGGKSGPAFEPGDATASRMIQRVHLPLEAKKHMPPKGKPQLTEEETALLEWWIEAGAPTRQRVAEVEPPPLVAELIATRLGVPPTPPPDRAAMVAAAETLERKLGILIRPLTADDPWLAANARLQLENFGDAQLAELAPIAPALHWLDVGETSVTDAGLDALAAMKNLRRLHLDRTAISDAGLKPLGALGHLEYLNLHGTKVTDSGLAALRHLPRLKSLYLWQTQVTPAAIAAFAEEQTDARKIARWKSEIAALEAKIRAEHFSANLGAGSGPVAPAAAEPVSMKMVPARADSGAAILESADGKEAVPANAASVNTVCPVSGETVDASVVETVGERLIAFCCEDCREKFNAAPEKYPLPAKR